MATTPRADRPEPARRGERLADAISAADPSQLTQRAAETDGPSQLGASAAAQTQSTAAASAPRPADAVVAPRLADAAERVMTQVVSTIRSFEASGKPALEARLHHAELGDVRLVVAGRAGEVVQAEVIVKSRVAADAIAHAALHFSTGDALAGVNVTVRTDGDRWAGGTTPNAHHGAGDFGGGAGQTGRHPGGAAGEAGAFAQAFGNGGDRPAPGPASDGARNRWPNQAAAPVAPADAQPRRTPGTKSTSLDIRA